MKNRRENVVLCLLCVAAVFIAACAGSPASRGNPSKKLSLTIGASENLSALLSNPDMDGKTLVWMSSDTTVASVDSKGIVTALCFSDAETGTGTAIIRAESEDGAFQTFTLTVTMAGQADIMTLPPLKDQFSRYFMLGNTASANDVSAAGNAIINTRLIRHYNALTSGNNMKPDSLSDGLRGNTISYSWTRGDNFVNAATASGFTVIGHTLLWHNQIPVWQQNMASAPRETALAAMKQYITDVVTRYRGKIYSWDVLNEGFPDDVRADENWRNAMRTATRGGQGANPWYASIGADFVYEGFLAARLADENAILYYNDYNLDNANKARMVYNMVRAVNERYKAAYPGATRKLIEGIGMQSHHNTNVPGGRIRASLELFKELGVIISISELDVLSQSWQQYSSQTPPTNEGKLAAANRYGEYFKVFLEYSDIIERVTFWGLNDDQSWRARAFPLLFEGSPSKAKPAYYKIIEALEGR